MYNTPTTAGLEPVTKPTIPCLITDNTSSCTATHKPSILDIQNCPLIKCWILNFNARLLGSRASNATCSINPAGAALLLQSHSVKSDTYPWYFQSQNSLRLRITTTSLDEMVMCHRAIMAPWQKAKVSDLKTGVCPQCMLLVDDAAQKGRRLQT